MKREIIAEDIIKYCKQKSIKFFVVKYRKGRVICSKNGEPYTEHQLGQGLSNLRGKNIAVPLSKTRWSITC